MLDINKKQQVVKIGDIASLYEEKNSLLPKAQ